MQRQTLILKSPAVVFGIGGRGTSRASLQAAGAIGGGERIDFFVEK
jgi:hypothetical protein